MDYVGIINPLLEPRTLVGIGHVPIITGIKIVKCILHTGDNTLTIHARCYHIPNDCARLQGPQIMFSTHV